MALEPVTDYVEQGLARLIGQYKDRPRMAAFLTALLNRTQERENATQDVLQLRLLANATAAQLDTIGKIVGQPRNGQLDDVYRVYIGARIIINRCHGWRVTLLTMLRLIEPAQFRYSESYPATAIVHYTDAPAASKTVLVDLAKQALSGGVALEMIFDTNQMRAFRFGDAADLTFNASVGLGDAIDPSMGGLLQDVIGS